MADVGRIDVVCVTRNGPNPAWLRNLDRLPVNKLIVERSSPLLAARRRALDKVSTEWFLWLDDDVYLCDGWMREAVKHVRRDVGAIQGREWLHGFGEKWDLAVNRFRWSKPAVEYEPGHRGTLVNTLMRMEAVRDWDPPDLELYAYEDYLITQHVLSRGYRWLDVKLPSWHTRTWVKHFTAAIRDMRALKQVEPARSKAKRMVKLLLSTVFALIPFSAKRLGTVKMGIRVRVFLLYQNISCILGLMFA
ncbi:MAG: glycosyltransferase family A protein [Thermoproteota archaeon]